MARFYASFDNSTVSAIEATSGNNYYQRLAITNGATLKTALVAARDALSAAMYAQLDTVNKNGLLGVVAPADGFTIGGGVLSGSNIYTNAQAVWQSDPRAVKTSVSTVTDITVANSTAVSPADPYSISSTLYTDATTAVQNVLNAIAAPSGFTGNGPYARLGQNTFRTLASIWTDHALTYIAWDDYSPGAPSTYTPTQPASQSRTLPLTITLPWDWQFTADRAGNAIVYARLDRSDGGGSQFYVMTNNVSTAASTGYYDSTLPANSLPVGTYQLTYRLKFQDPYITSHYGNQIEYISGTNFVNLTI
jgi:hypothetical protein